MKQAANKPAPEFQISFVNKYVAIAVIPLNTIKQYQQDFNKQETSVNANS